MRAYPRRLTEAELKNPLNLTETTLEPNGLEIWRPQNADHLSELISELCLKLKRTGAEYGFSPPELRLRTVLEEAVFNAWLHGNGENPHKAISVLWVWSGHLRLEVSDEGSGFDHDRLPDPTTPENITKPSGRGIFIIRYYADEVYWRDGGRRIIMILNCPPEAEGCS
ncbi:MAG: ATP-binding protein [Thermodesulfobacteriota bacterium]